MFYTKYISIGLAGVVLVSSMGNYGPHEHGSHEHVPEDFYPTIRLVEAGTALTTGSFVDMRSLASDYGAPLSGRL
jgi:hypothetical protein